MTASEWDWTLRVFDHVQLNASDYTASVRFYEAVLSPLGIPKIAEHEQGTWSSAWTDFTDLNVLDRRPPTTNLHLCFYARSKEQVDAFHRAGVEAGFRSNGAPGYRDYAPGYYAAYLLDPDGNNVEALYRDVIDHGCRRTSRSHRNHHSQGEGMSRKTRAASCPRHGRQGRPDQRRLFERICRERQHRSQPSLRNLSPARYC